MVVAVILLIIAFIIICNICAANAAKKKQQMENERDAHVDVESLSREEIYNKGFGYSDKEYALKECAFGEINKLFDKAKTINNALEQQRKERDAEINRISALCKAQSNSDEDLLKLIQIIENNSNEGTIDCNQQYNDSLDELHRRNASEVAMLWEYENKIRKYRRELDACSAQQQEYLNAVELKNNNYIYKGPREIYRRIAELRQNKIYQAYLERRDASHKFEEEFDDYKDRFNFFWGTRIYTMGRNGSNLAIWSYDWNYKKYLTIDDIVYYEVEKTIESHTSHGKTPSLLGMAVDSAIWGTAAATVKGISEVNNSQTQYTSERVVAKIYFANQTELNTGEVSGASEVNKLNRILPEKRR